MQIDTLGESLSGRLLVSMPSLMDPALKNGVVLVCAHSPNGALGLLINRLATGTTFRDLLVSNGLTPAAVVPKRPIHVGGPAEVERPLALHGDDYHLKGNTVHVTSDISMTSDPTLLQDLSLGRGPKHSILALGYCAWSKGELEDELGRGVWLMKDTTFQSIFRTRTEDIWAKSIRAMGLAPSGLSGLSGHA